MKRALALVVVASVAAFAATPFVPIERERFARPPESVVVTDRNGVVLRVVRTEGVDHRWVPLEEVSPHYVAAIVAAEDARFFEHGGVDVRALARALVAPLLPGRRTSGASTLAQQTIKLTHGRPGGALGKPLEMARALALVRNRSRAFVLEEYVNRLPFGNGIVGVSRASEVYFGKRVRDLDLGEAALLAGIPQAPSRTEPFRHGVRALSRRAYVLDRLEATRAYPREVLDAARREPLVLASSDVHPYRAARFVERAMSTRAIDVRDGVLRTSLDLRAQDSLERAVDAAAATGASRGATNACGIVLSVETGEVLAYVGAARDALDDEGGAIDLVAHRRHPGSTLKPFVYGLFFETGANPATYLDDSLHAMTGADGSTYDVANFDGTARGRVQARDALAASLNLAALDAARVVGAERIADALSRLGFGSVIDGSHHGIGLALGGASASPFEIARAYLALARGGERVEPSFVPRATGNPGSASVSHVPRRRVLEANAVALVTDVLRDAAARRNGFGGSLEELAPSGPFALKTGTSPEGRDAWGVAYDERFVVVVWVGDPRGRPSRGLTGFANAAPSAVNALESVRTIALAPGAVASRSSGPRVAAPLPLLGTLRLCARTGWLAGASCPVRLERTRGDVPEPCEGHELRERVARPRIVSPRDGARLVVDQTRTLPSLEVRVDGATRVYVDGELSRRVRLVPGIHRVRALDAEGHAAEATFVVDTLVATAAQPRR